MKHQLPPNLKPEDEGRHATPAGAEELFFADTLWVSVVDPEANIFGVNHYTLGNRGFARFEALYVIDGVVQLYGNKVPLDPEPDNGPWSDGRLTYEVVEPFEHIRISLDWRAFGFELDFTGRFAAFDYADSVRGDPLKRATGFHIGHYEQAMDCEAASRSAAAPPRVRRGRSAAGRIAITAGRIASPTCPSGRWRRSTSPCTTGPPSSFRIGISMCWACTRRTAGGPRRGPSAVSYPRRTATSRCWRRRARSRPERVRRSGRPTPSATS